MTSKMNTYTISKTIKNVVKMFLYGKESERGLRIKVRRRMKSKDSIPSFIRRLRAKWKIEDKWVYLDTGYLNVITRKFAVTQHW